VRFGKPPIIDLPSGGAKTTSRSATSLIEAHVAGIGFLQGDQHNVMQAVAMEASDGLEIACERLGPAFRSAMSRSVAWFVISLICCEFISVLLCGDLVPTRTWEPKKPRMQENGREQIDGRLEQATGVTRVARGGTVCPGSFTC